MAIKLFTNVEIGDVPRTPAQPYFNSQSLDTARRTLLLHALDLGYPISFAQEQSGALIQNILPVHKTEYDQISTSSKVQLALHTEAAFHPYKPDYVMLLCLRGDSSAVTTYANVDDIVKLLDNEMISYLQDPVYSTGVDKSFRSSEKKYKEVTLPVLKKIGNDEYNFLYDEDLMKPTNILASMALEKLSEAISKCIKEVVLQTGDLLIIDNNKTIHGRKPFQPKYDGTDRWVQRMLVRKELPPKEQMNGHIVITQFEE
jgi:alpha-ketoglutarate-dependent taurine dioxygenase